VVSNLAARAKHALMKSCLNSLNFPLHHLLSPKPGQMTGAPIGPAQVTASSPVFSLSLSISIYIFPFKITDLNFLFLKMLFRLKNV
jgi:hypothetical protein